MVWSRLLSSFDPDEETVNFGTRFAFESEEKLFDVVTQATIHYHEESLPDSPIDYPSSLVSESSGEELHLSLGPSLHILRESSPVSFGLSADVSLIQESPCRKFLLLGIGPDIRLLHLPSGSFLPPIPLNGSSPLIAGTFGEEKALTLVNASSSLIHIQNIDLDAIHEALLQSDIGELKRLQGEMSIEKPVSLGAAYSHSIKGNLFYNDKQLASIHLGNAVQTRVADLSHLRIRSLCASSSSPGLIFLLDELSGFLFILCPLTLITLKSWREEPSDDIVLLEEESSNDLQLILITRRGTLQIREFPSFNLIYELKIHEPFTRLMQTCINQETPLFLEGSEKGSEKCLRVRGIVEASPDARLNRLLRRNKFDEALSFAKTFRLDFEDIYKAKIVWLLERLSPWVQTPPEQAGKFFEELKVCMSALKDKDFVVQTCVKAALPDIKSTRALLAHAREMIKDNLSEFPVDLLVFVSQVLQKIDTFRLLGGSDVEEWIAFVEGSSYAIMLGYIQRKELFHAKLMWVRHLAEFTLMFDAECILEILEEFRGYGEEDILEWCEAFVPESLKLVPESLPIISDWAHSVVLSMESRRGWPLSGLDFAQKILKSMTFASSGIDEELNTEAQLVLFQERSKGASSLNRFVSLIDVLKDLLVLHNNFRLKIKLRDFLEADKGRVVGILLDWSSPEEIPALVSGYLNEYLRRGGELNASDVYEEYLLDLVENTSATWHWNAGAAPWEEKVAALVPFVLSVERKAAVILKSLKAAPVPWSKVMTDLCALGSNLPSTSLSVAIKEQETLVALKQILKRYNFRSDEVLHKLQAEKMMKIILKKSGGSREGFRDILEISSVMSFLEERDATLAYIRYLLQNNSTCPMKEVTALVNAENREFLCRRILSYAVVFKKYARKDEEGNHNLELQNYISFLSTAMDESVPFSVRQEFESLKKVFEVSKKIPLPKDPYSEEHLREYISSNYTSFGLKELLVRLGMMSSSLEDTKESSLLLVYLLEELLKRECAEDVKSLMERLSQRPPVPSSDLSSLIRLILTAVQVPENDSVVHLETLVANNLATADVHLLDLCEVSIWLRSISSFLSTRGKGGFNYNIHSSLYKDKGLPVSLQGVQAFVQTLTCLFPLSEQCTPTRYQPICILFQNKESPPEPAQDNTIICFGSAAQPTFSFDYGQAIDDLSRNLVSSVDEARKNAQSSLALCVYMRYRANLHLLKSASLLSLDPGSSEQINQKALVTSLFNNILDERKKELDVVLGLSCLLSEGPESVQHILSGTKSSSSQDFPRLATLARLGFSSAHILGLIPTMNKYKGNLQSVLWAKRLVDLGVSVKDAFVHSPQDKERVLGKLVKSEALSIEDLLNFASAFDFLGDEVLVAYAEEQLSGSSSSKGLDAMSLINSISCSSLARAMLNKMWGLASPYNYEVLDVVIRGLQARASPNESISKAGEVLAFLKCYSRDSSPSEAERNIWLEKHKSDFKKFPEDDAKKRLPLTPLVALPRKEKFNLLQKEFQLSNYNLWVDVSHLLNFNSDNIRISAIENAFNGILSPESDNVCVESKYEKILEKIYDCLSSMKNFFKATSCAYWILNKLPRGKDKVTASEKCRMIAQRWKEEAAGTPDEARSVRALEFAVDDQFRVQTEFVLIKYGLASQTYLDLVAEKCIDTLILNLFEHESIIERSKTAGGYYPDINGAVDEIAKIQNVQITSLKYEMLTNWLPENKDLNYLDESLSLDIHQSSRSKDVNQETDYINYIRCVYISQCSELHNFLISIALGRASADIHSTSHKLRALRCLLSVVDETVLCKMMHMTYKKIQELYSNLVFVHKLESLGLHYDLETYKSCDKKVLIESVIRSSGVNKEGLSLIIDLSIFFSIYDSLLWNDLLGRLVQYSSSKLEFVLLKLNHQPHLWHLDNFSSAWNHLVRLPFLSNESHSECDKALLLLNKCPLSLDVEEIISECSRLGFNDLAQKLTDTYL